MPKFIKQEDINAFDLRIEIADCWITVRDDMGNVLLRERAEIDGRLAVQGGVISAIEPLWSWMTLHLREAVEEHKTLLAVVSPNITDAECQIIKACVSAFSPLLAGFVEMPVAAAYDLIRQQPPPSEYLLYDVGEQTAWAAVFSSGRMVAYKEIRGDYELNIEHSKVREMKEALQATYPTSPVLQLK